MIHQWRLNLLQNVEAETVMEGLDAMAQRFSGRCLYKEVTDTGLTEANNTVLRGD